MARIAGVNVPLNKRVEVGLTYIYGIGRSTSNKLLSDAGISPDTYVRDLTEDEVTKLRDAVLDHAQNEEAEEFPVLAKQLDEGDLKLMTTAVRAAEAIAPTRPHPGVESAKLNFAVGPFASMLDRARDLIAKATG